MNSSDQQNSALCSFDETLSHLTFIKGKPVRPTPWRTDLEIGADIKFELVGYKLVSEQENFKFSTQKRGDESTMVYRDVKTFVEVDDQGDEREVASEDIVKSYVYGDKIIPFSTYDSETMSYKSGPRSLKLIGFTKQRNIPKYILQGKGVTAFTSGQSSAVAFAAFYEALVSLNLVGLVRRVYNRNNAPTIGTLYPETLNGKKMLTFIELPFAQDINALKFPSLQHVTSTIEQKNAVNELIDALDLSDPNNPENELFNPEKTYDPHRQFMYHVFTEQFLHPEEPSPTEPPEHVKKLRSLPPEMREKAEPKMELIRQLFPLKEVEKKQWRRGKASDDASEEQNKENENENSADAEQTGMASVFKPTVVQVTAQQPVQDFEILLKKGENHTEVCNQMKKVITVLAQRIVEVDDLLKLIAALKTLRKSCLEKNPTLYNNWLPELKNLVQERKLNSLWEKVEEEQLGLISSKETATSSIPEEDANSFLKLGSLEIEQEVDGDDLMMDL